VTVVTSSGQIASGVLSRIRGSGKTFSTYAEGGETKEEKGIWITHIEDVRLIGESERQGVEGTLNGAVMGGI